jgi:hypothetical protein
MTGVSQDLPIVILPLVVLFGIVIVFKAIAETWLKGRGREQRPTFYRDSYLKSEDWKRKRSVVLSCSLWEIKKN